MCGGQWRGNRPWRRPGVHDRLYTSSRSRRDYRECNGLQRQHTGIQYQPGSECNKLYLVCSCRINDNSGTGYHNHHGNLWKYQWQHICSGQWFMRGRTFLLPVCDGQSDTHANHQRPGNCLPGNHNERLHHAGRDERI